MNSINPNTTGSILGKHPLEDAVVPDSKIARYEEKSVPMDVEGEIKLDDPISPIPLLPIELYQEILKRALLAGVSYSDLCRVCKGFKALTFDTANRLFSAPIEDLKNYFPKSWPWIESIRFWHAPTDPMKTLFHSIRRVVLLSPSILAVLPSSSEEDGIEKKLKKDLLPFTDEMFSNLEQVFKRVTNNYFLTKKIHLSCFHNFPYDMMIILNQLTLSQESKKFFQQWKNPESTFNSIQKPINPLAIECIQGIRNLLEQSFEIMNHTEEFKNNFKSWKNLLPIGNWQPTDNPCAIIKQFNKICSNGFSTHLMAIGRSLERRVFLELIDNYTSFANNCNSIMSVLKEPLKKNDFIKNWLKQKTEETDPSLLTNDIQEKYQFNMSFSFDISIRSDHKDLQMDQKLFEYIDQFIVSDNTVLQMDIIFNRYLQSIFDRVITYKISPFITTTVHSHYFNPTFLRIFSNLETLSLSNISLIEFGLSYSTALTQLTISDSELPYFPPDLQKMTQLRHLHFLKNTRLNSIDLLYSLTQLETLILPKYRCAYDITHFTSFSKLQMLTAPQYVNVVDLPSTIERMTALKTLHLESFWSRVLPKTMENMTQLTSFKLGHAPHIDIHAYMCQKKDPTISTTLNKAFHMRIDVPDLAFTDSMYHEPAHHEKSAYRRRFFTLPYFPLFREIPVQIYLEDAGKKIYSKESPYKLTFYTSNTSTDQLTVTPSIEITATFPHVALKKKKVASTSKK